jgi:hypothetical protein
MATLTKDQLAAQLNYLQSTGATDAQIGAAITAAGYNESAFTISMDGKFEPEGSGSGMKVAGVDYNSYTPEPEPAVAAKSTANTKVTSTTSVVETTSGGSSTTNYAPPATISTDAKASAKLANQRADAFTANTSGKFGAGTIDKAVATGAITADEAAALKSGSISEADRFATAQSSRASGKAAVDAGTTSSSPIVATTAEPNTTATTVTTVKAAQDPPLSITAASDPAAAPNTTTVTNTDGTTSEISKDNNAGTETLTPVASNPIAQSTETSVTVSQPVENATSVANDSYVVPAEEEITFSPLQEPPGVPRDEFDGIDQQVSDNENGLQEPPQLSDEEVDAYLQQGGEPTQDGEPAVVAASASGTSSATGVSKAAAPTPVTAKKTPYTADDWRIRLSLADTANYLYKTAGKTDILYPLVATDGVVFPYSPTINTSYRANYDPSELTHSNYKMFFYKNSSVDDISITADFTAQDTAEANYMLAVIHFFKSATKMFYGQDTAPRAGTPPPLLYLTGYGHHQFENHPLLLTNFTYNLPNDVDYIRAGSNATWGGADIAKTSSRLASAGLQPGGVAKPASFSGLASKDKVTYLPTKIQITLGLVPVVTRNDISKNFSLKDYAAGKFSGRTGGGIW